MHGIGVYRTEMERKLRVFFRQIGIKYFGSEPFALVMANVGNQ